MQLSRKFVLIKTDWDFPFLSIKKNPTIATSMVLAQQHRLWIFKYGAAADNEIVISTSSCNSIFVHRLLIFFFFSFHWS